VVSTRAEVVRVLIEAARGRKFAGCARPSWLTAAGGGGSWRFLFLIVRTASRSLAA